MSDLTNSILDRIVAERDRQRSLPGSEFDAKNSVNDWVAIATHYISESAKRKCANSFYSDPVSQEEYEDSLVKAAAVIVAALEYSDLLKKNGELK